ncbi:hypothetical protein FOL47_010594, partial [Perkinsus chesapeaki]
DTNLIAVKDSETFVVSWAILHAPFMRLVECFFSNSQLDTPHYVFGQITKYFKPGYRLLTSLGIPDPGRLPDGIFPAGIEAMAAISPDGAEIVLTVSCVNSVYR